MARNKVRDGIKSVCDCEFANSGATVYQVMDMFFHEEIRAGWSGAVADEYDDSGYVEVNEGDVIVQFEGNIDDTNYRFIWAIDDDDAFGLVILAVDGDSLEPEEAEDLVNTFAEQYYEAGGKKNSKLGKGSSGNRNGGSRANSHFNFGAAGAASSDDDDDDDDDDYDEDDEEDYDDSEDEEDYEDDEESCCCGGRRQCCCDEDDDDCDDCDDCDDDDYDEDDDCDDCDDDDYDDEDDEDEEEDYRSKRRRR